MKTCIFMVISKSVVLRVRYVSDNVIDKINTHILCSRTLFQKWCCSWDYVENIVQPNRSHTEIICRSCIFHTGFQRLQIHTQNMYYLLLSYSNVGYTSAPQCYVYMYNSCLISISFYIQVKRKVTINT